MAWRTADDFSQLRLMLLDVLLSLLCAGPALAFVLLSHMVLASRAQRQACCVRCPEPDGCRKSVSLGVRSVGLLRGSSVAG